MNFDRVADVYDATRALPPEVLERIADRVIDSTGAADETRFLEMGIGTGRIAASFIERGYRYTGVDISEEMMGRLQEKFPDADNLTLIEGDITQLPFPDDSFDVIIVVHVFHLFPAWRDALSEGLRVLKPGGYFVLGQDRGVPGTPAVEIRREWRRLVTEAGVELRPEYGSWETAVRALTEARARTAVWRVAHWQREERPIDLLERLRRRTYSQSWEVQDEVLEQVHGQLLPWATDRYGSVDQPLQNEFEFLLSVSRVTF